MLADECPAGIAPRQETAAIEHQSEWGDMVAERVVGRDGAGDQIGTLGLHPHIDVRAVIAVGKAVESAILHRRQEVRNQVAAELVAFIHHGP